MKNAVLLFLLVFSINDCSSQTTITDELPNIFTTVTPATTTPILSLLFDLEDSRTATNIINEVKNAEALAVADISGDTTTTIIAEGTTSLIDGSGSGSIDVTTQPSTTVTIFEVTTSETGSGFTDDVTTVEAGSGITTDATTIETVSGISTDATTIETGSGLTTDATTIVDGTTASDIGSGVTDDNVETTTPDVTTSSMEGSGSGIDATTNADVTSKVDATTKFEVTTFTAILNFTDTTLNFTETTNFTVTTAAAAVVSTSLPWYIIVIICFGILILILLIVFIVICCLYKKAVASPTKTKDPIVAGDTEKTVEAIKMQSLPAYVPKADTIRPEPKNEPKPITSFISDTPMDPPKIFEDPVYAAVIKGKMARTATEPKHSSYEDDEGYDEPLLRRERTHRPARRKPTSSLRTPQASWEDGTELVERAPTNYQPYFLPTPVQTALTSKALENTLTDDAIARRHALQRSDIERHRNKQRLRAKSRHKVDPFEQAQRDIDAVLVPPPPAVLQPSAQTRRRVHKKHGKMDISKKRNHRTKHSDAQLLMNDRPGRYRSYRSDTEDSTVSDEKPQPSHEATISKMAKLLEEAYALLAPAVQKNLIGPTATPVASTQQSAFQAPPLVQGHAPYIPVVPPPPPNQLSSEQSDRLFAPRIQNQPNPGLAPNVPATNRLFEPRVQTPPALLPPPNVPVSTQNSNYTPYIQNGANDANSIIWTPYRTFDQLLQLQNEDPMFARPDLSTHPSDTPTISSHHPGLVTDTFPHSTTGILEPSSSSIRGPPVTSNQQSGHTSTTPPQTLNSIENPAYLEDDTEPASSIVQSIKDTLAKLTGSSTPVQELSDPEAPR